MNIKNEAITTCLIAYNIPSGKISMFDKFRRQANIIVRRLYIIAKTGSKKSRQTLHKTYIILIFIITIIMSRNMPSHSHITRQHVMSPIT